MAITFVQKRKRQKYLILAFAIVLVITAIFLWQGFFKKEKPKVSPIKFPPLREIGIDKEVLESEFLKEAQPFEEIPPLEEEKGRENPFLPY